MKTWSKLSKKELEILFDKLTFALSSFKDKQKYKKLLAHAIKDARVLIKKRNLKMGSFLF